jgi:hypothetical protein
MCNPRRVMIELRRAIEGAWRTTVEQAATATADVAQLARIHVDIPLDAEMGDAALVMLERILRGDFPEHPPWQRDAEGAYRHDLGDVVLVYQPGSRRLAVEARLTEMISAEARAAAEVSGFTVGEVAVEAVGHYYSDGWGGRTEERARADAQADAERKLADAVEALHRQQHAPELQAAEAQARARAEQQAALDLAQRQTEVRDALRQRLQAILANAEERVYHTMNRLVGEAYRRTLIQMVQENGGRVLSDERSGSVINLEMELF